MRALVFGGGGAKGSYQIGVWTALNEAGLDFQIVTGSSIGAVNGALYVQGDYELAKKLWSEITLDGFMAHGLDFDSPLDTLLEQRDAIRSFVTSYVHSKGADISPFRKLLGRTIDENKFMASPCDFALTTARFPSFKPVEVRKRDIKPGYLVPWLLASAACFPALPLSEIDGLNYIDGMHNDNLPIATAFRLGAEQVVAVELTPQICHKVYLEHPAVTIIAPRETLGTFLCFDRQVLDHNMALGYDDALKALGRRYGYAGSFVTPSLSSLKPAAERFLVRLSQVEAQVFPEDESPCYEFLRGITRHTSSAATELYVAAAELCAGRMGLKLGDYSDFDALLSRMRLGGLQRDEDVGGHRLTLGRIGRSTEDSQQLHSVIADLFYRMLF